MYEKIVSWLVDSSTIVGASFLPMPTKWRTAFQLWFYAIKNLEVFLNYQFGAIQCYEVLGVYSGGVPSSRFVGSFMQSARSAPSLLSFNSCQAMKQSNPYADSWPCPKAPSLVHGLHGYLWWSSRSSRSPHLASGWRNVVKVEHLTV